MTCAGEPVPVVPAAHYTCGGVIVDLASRTDIAGLYAVGETAYTGLHGANRLASNSLLECLVFAEAAAADIIKRHADLAKPRLAGSTASVPPDWDESRVSDSDEQVVIVHNWSELRRFMWDYVGIVRTNKRLERGAAPHRSAQTGNPRLLRPAPRQRGSDRAAQPRSCRGFDRAFCGHAPRESRPALHVGLSAARGACRAQRDPSERRSARRASTGADVAAAAEQGATQPCEAHSVVVACVQRQHAAAGTHHHPAFSDPSRTAQLGRTRHLSGLVWFE